MTKTANFTESTLGGPRPGDFPLGSLQSRAAARSMLLGREVPRMPGMLIRFVSPASVKSGAVERGCSCKPAKPGTIAFCYCFADSSVSATEDGTQEN